MLDTLHVINCHSYGYESYTVLDQACTGSMASATLVQRTLPTKLTSQMGAGHFVGL